MSTIQKNIYTIQEKLAKLKPGSRAYNKYIERLSKKINQYKRYSDTRTRDESLIVKTALEDGVLIDVTNLKHTSAF